MKSKSIKITSNNITYGLAPEPTKEVEQLLYISSSGEVWFKARNYDQHLVKEGFCREKHIDIGPWKAQFLIHLIETIECEKMITDCGSFEIEFYDEDRLNTKKYGDLIGVDAYSYGHKPVDITKVLRRYVPVRSLWGFSDSMSPDYEGKKAIHLFAKKWENIFANWQEGMMDFDEGLGKECTKLGFQMDSGKEFFKNYPKFFDLKDKELESVISEMNDIDLLGSAVFSYWRYLTHWAQTGLDKDDCKRFRLLFRQMREVTTKYAFTKITNC